jgi:hypothetical protein
VIDFGKSVKYICGDVRVFCGWVFCRAGAKVVAESPEKNQSCRISLTWEEIKNDEPESKSKSVPLG